MGNVQTPHVIGPKTALFLWDWTIALSIGLIVSIVAGNLMLKTNSYYCNVL